MIGTGAYRPARACGSVCTLIVLLVNSFDYVGKDDVQLFSSKLNISSGDRSIPVPFSVSDDFIHERLECFIVQLVKATDNKDKGLYMIGFNHTVKLCIEDNDGWFS